MVKKYKKETSFKFSKKYLFYILGLPTIESLLIFIFGLLISKPILIFGNFSYYGYSLLAFLPFLIYLLYKKIELCNLFENLGLQTIWFAVIWLGQLIPAFIFIYLLPNLHHAPISTTILSAILTAYLSYAITLFFFYYFFRRFKNNLKLLLFAIIGLVLATLFIQNNNIGSEFGFILRFEAIFISLAPVLFGLSYNVYKERGKTRYIFNQFIMTESFGIFSLITLLLAYLVNNAIPQGTIFDLAKLSVVQFIFIGLLSFSTSFLFVFLISIIILLLQLRDEV